LCNHLALSEQLTEDGLSKVRASVVKVEIIVHPAPTLIPKTQLPNCFNGAYVCIAGTGIVVSKTGDVITASHVAADSVKLINDLHALHIDARMVIGISIPNTGNKVLTVASNTSLNDVEIKAIDPLHDLALLHVTNLPVSRVLIKTPTQEVKSPGWPAPVKIAPERAKDVEPIFACGFPLGESALVTTSGTVASAWSDETVLTARALPNAMPIDVYKLDIQITFGNSGGPIFRLSDNAVVGIVIEGSTVVGGAPTAVPSKYIAEFLANNGVSWEKAEREKPLSRKN
jgi:hypothetical protein